MALFGTRKAASRAASPKESAPFLVAFRTEVGGMMVKLDPAQIASPGVAGIMVVDIMRHMARAMTQYGTTSSQADATARMLELIRAEIDNPTDLGNGSIVN